VKSAVSTQTEAGVAIVPVSSVAGIATDAGLSSSDSAELTTIYSESQVSSLRVSFFALILFALGSLLFSRNIPNQTVARRAGKARAARQSP